MDSGKSRKASERDLALIRQFNRTEREFPAQVTLQHLIEQQVTKHASETAVICDHDKAFAMPSLTFGQLNERVNQLARFLKSEGVGPGQIVGIVVERSYAMIIGILAILKAGGAYLPISPADPPDRIRCLLEDAGVKTLLVQKKTGEKASFHGHIVDVENQQLYTGPADNPEEVNKPTDLAYVIYTSGSTGKPKGVMIEHRSVVNRLHWMQCAYPIDSRDVILQKTPYCFDVSVWELFWWALQGAKLCLLTQGGEKLPLAIVETGRKHQVSVMHFVPSMLNVFLEYLEGKSARVWEGMSSVRQVFASGEALTPSHVRRFNEVWGRKTGASLTNLYGPTEATVDVTYFDCPTHDNFEKIPIGRPIHNTRIYIMRDGYQAAIGETGELCIAGVGLARGYLNNPGLTGERFMEDPGIGGERIYRTGDLARWLPDGNIEYLGREDHQVKIRGLRIELGEIENAIREYAGISDCVVTVRKYSESIIQIIAYVAGASELDVVALRGYLKKRLPEYMVPNRIERIDAIPLSPHGKADRNALPEPFIHGIKG